MSKSDKGGPFEREITASLSRWWSYGEADDLFWRSSGSGGRATRRAKKGKKTEGHHGDLAPTCDKGQALLSRICFELKRGYSKHTLSNVFEASPKSPAQMWEKWIDQAAQAATDGGIEHWAIIARRDRRQACIWFPVRLGRKIVKKKKIPYSVYALAREPLRGVYGLRYADFLKYVDPKDFAEALGCLHPYSS